MQKTLIIGNWKQNKTLSQALEWVAGMHLPVASEKEVILCPAFTLLYPLTEQIKSLSLQLVLGSQDFPAFADGAHTGEEPGALLHEYVRYAIIGHSERRHEFSETEEQIARKVKLAKQYGIEPIFCVQGLDTPVPEGVSIIAYEPVSAVGTGNPENPENAESVAKELSNRKENITVVYGGSVTADNVSMFTSQSSISGVLVGTASLDASSFSQIAENA